jgi:hypothetical protein
MTHISMQRAGACAVVATGKKLMPLALPPRPRQTVDQAAADRVREVHETIGTVRVAYCSAAAGVPPRAKNDIRRERYQSRRVAANGSASTPAQRWSIRTLPDPVGCYIQVKW